MLKTLNVHRLIHPSWHFLAFILGIVAGDIFTLVTRSTFVATPLWLVFAVAALFLCFIRPLTLLLPLALISGFLCINFRTAQDLAGQDHFQALVGKTLEIEGRLPRDPDTTDSNTTFRLTDLKIGGQSLPGTLYVQTAKNSELRRSDTVRLSGKLSGGFGTYVASLYRPTVQEITHHEDLFLDLRNNFADQVKTYLKSDEAALGLGYLLGIRSGLPKDLLETLRVVGLTHIIVTSGTHLSILVGFARKVFGKLSRFAALLGSGLLIVIYVGIVGLTPSMLRTSLVSLLSLATWYVGRRFHPFRLLALVAAVTLLYNPMYLIDLAWLLSFAAFAGVLVVGPALTKFFYGQNKPGFIASVVLETLSASLLCAPILLYFYGTLSLISIAANLLILPTISAAMFLTFATGLAGLFGIIPLAQLFALLANTLLGYHVAVVNFLGAQTSFLIEIEAENPQVFLLYLPLALPFFVKTLYNIYKCRQQSSNPSPKWLSSEDSWQEL